MRSFLKGVLSPIVPNGGQCILYMQLESVGRGYWVSGGAPLGVGETFHFRCLNYSVTR